MSNISRAAFEGFRYGSPISKKNLNINLWAAYEWKENLFFEVNLNVRKQEGSSNNVFSSIGMRWNMFRREYDY